MQLLFVGRPFVCFSVRLSLPFACRMLMPQVCCCGPGGQVILIDHGSRWVLQQHGIWWANVGSAMLSADTDLLMLYY